MTTPTSRRHRFEPALPANNEQLRTELFDGGLFHLGSTPSSRRLVERGRELLVAALGDVDEDVRLAPAKLANADLFARMGALRRQLYLDEEFHALLRQLVGAGKGAFNLLQGILALLGLKTVKAVETATLANHVNDFVFEDGG